ncbi:MAG: hypothetical protein FJ087_22600 [Deltaproteobacteria bacterium]|nr:hypothetical protein [Deltaproteobacteria bacterium]
MNPYQDKRRAELLQLLDPQQTTDQVVQALSDFVESEVRAAYRRGYQHGRDRAAPTDRRHFGDRGSAVQNGRLHPVGSFH